MPTCCSDSSQVAGRFPVAESLFQDSRLQPYVHNCEVTVVEGCHTYHFCVFFKWHCHLRRNMLVSSESNEFWGDAVVMRLGMGPQRVVNMRSRDMAIADYMIRR